jgi:uncharacterized protein YlxW (UPF0749 family)
VNRPTARVAVAIVACLLGFLVIVQLRSQAAGTQLASLSAQELTVLVANLNTRNDQLRTEVATLDRELTTLQDAKSRGQSSLDELGQDLQKFRAWAGLDPVTGPGVRVTVAGPIDGETVMDLINELRNAGAESLAIGGVRVVPLTVASGPAGSIAVEGQPLPDPFVIDAIGASDTITGALTRPGGIQSQLAATFPDVTVTVTPVDKLLLAASTRDLQPAHGTPRL